MTERSSAAPIPTPRSEESLWPECEAAVIALDPQGIVTHWSLSAERLFAMPAADAIGAAFAPRLFADRFTENAAFVNQLSTPGDLPTQTVLIPSPCGATAQAAIAAVRRRWNGTLLTMMLAPAPSEGELSPRALRGAAAKRVISYLSHEVRIPLAAILGFAEMMYDAKQTVSERLQCIRRIRSNVKHLTELMDDISDLSRIESGDLRLQPVTFSLLPELGEVFSLLQTHAWKKRLELRLTFQGPVPETVYLDASRLRQVLFNVVGEVIEEAARGTISITVSAVRENGQLGLQFQIAGPRPEAPGDGSEKFEPFPRRDEGSGFLFGGHRLGLALARRLARLLGGDVAVGARGETFTIFIRAGTDQQTYWLQDVNDGDLKMHDTAHSASPLSPLEGMRVLLVEDSADIQLLVRHFLKKQGARVDLAENGEEGVEKAQATPFDAILMDLQLPVMNGFEATQQLRRSGATTPIIALTAHALSDVREKCLRAGFDDYMTKPIHAAALVEALQRHRPAPTQTSY